MSVFEHILPGPQARETPVALETRKESGSTATLLGYGAAKYLRAQLLVTEASPGKWEAPAETATADGATLDAVKVEAATLQNVVVYPPIIEPSPALLVTIEDTVDEGVNWNAVGAFVPTTVAGRQALNVTEPFSDLVRVSWTIPEGTSYTFQVDWVAE